MKKFIVRIVIALIAVTSAFGISGCRSNGDLVPVTDSSAVTSASSEAEENLNESSGEDSQAENDNTSVSDENNNASAAEGESSVHLALRAVLETSEAEGYTISTIEGSESDFLVVSFGDIEASRYYEVYMIGENIIADVGMLEGSHTSAYVSSETGNLCIYQAQMGNYSYGPVEFAEGTVSVNWTEEGYTDSNEDYPDVPGEIIEFSPMDDYDLISGY